MLPGGNDDCDVHGDGYLKQNGSVHIQDNRAEPVHDHVSGKHHKEQRSESMWGSRNVCSHDDWRRMRDCSLFTGIGIVLPEGDDYGDVHDGGPEL